MSYIVRVTKQGLTHCPACSQYIRVAAELSSTCCDFCGATLRIEVQRAEPTFGSRIQAVGRGALLAGLLAGSTVLGVGCSDPEESCDPEVDLECEEIDGDSNIGNDYGAGPFNNTPNNNDSFSGPFRFVMVEDESSDDLDGPTPGADIDAIGIDVNSDFVMDYWASSVEDFNISGDNNEHIDTEDLLGPPDVECTAEHFTSLGGTNGDNYVIVGFNNGTAVTFGSGTLVQVWELSFINCDEQTEPIDDEITLSVSISNDRSSFERIGSVGSGPNAVTIP
jgi:hypothetical protein